MSFLIKIILVSYIIWLIFIIYKNSIYNYMNDIIDHINKIKYTINHKKAYLQTQKKYKTYKYTIRGIFHDTNKILLLILSIIS